jgi:hypothetical protein
MTNEQVRECCATALFGCVAYNSSAYMRLLLNCKEFPTTEVLQAVLAYSAWRLRPLELVWFIYSQVSYIFVMILSLVAGRLNGASIQNHACCLLKELDDHLCVKVTEHVLTRSICNFLSLARRFQ